MNEETVRLIASGLIGGLTATLVGHFLTKNRESRNRILKAKNSFGETVSGIIAKIPPKAILDYHNSTKPDLVEAEIKLRRVLGWWERYCLRRPWREYDQFGQQQLNPENESEVNREIDALAGNTVEHPEDILKRNLQKLYDFSA